MVRKIKILLGLFILIGLVPSISNGESQDIRVKLSIEIPYNQEIELKTNDGFILEDNLGISSLNESEIKLTINDNDDIDIYDFYGNLIYTGNLSSFTISGYDSITIKDKEYRGKLYFVEEGSLYVINKLDVEDYLKGVIPREISVTFPDQAILAQIMISRSFAYRNINSNFNKKFDLCDTTKSQVYSGKSVENEKFNNLIEETRSKLIYYGEEIANTTFHSSNGGYIESSKNIWGGEVPYLISKEDPYSEKVDESWVYKISKSELENKLSGLGILGNLMEIKILEKFESGRVKDILFKGSLGNIVIEANKLRNILGNTEFKSTLFDILDFGNSLNNFKKQSFEKHVLTKNGLNRIIDKDIFILNSQGMQTYQFVTSEDEIDQSFNVGEEITFKGKGYGHGVGLSQRGARQMALEGFKFEEIIGFYYPGVEIR